VRTAEFVASSSPFEQLGGAYFHQDWPYDFETPQGVVEDFFRDEPDAGPELLDQVEQLLAAGLTDDELGEAMQRAGFCLDPTGLGLTNRVWLEDLARLAREQIGRESTPRG